MNGIEDTHEQTYIQIDAHSLANGSKCTRMPRNMIRARTLQYIYTGLQRISPTDLNNPPFQPLILFISKFIQYFNIYQWIGTPCCAGNHGG